MSSMQRVLDPDTLLICLVRHGESAWNKWRRESFTKFRLRDWLVYDPGIVDPHLTPKGHLDALTVKEKLTDAVTTFGSPFQLVCTSPLTRAIQTAQNIFGYKQAEVSGDGGGGTEGTSSSNTHLMDSQRRLAVLPWLREWRSTWGDVGLSRMELEKRYPQLDLIIQHNTTTGAEVAPGVSVHSSVVRVADKHSRPRLTTSAPRRIRHANGGGAAKDDDDAFQDGIWWDDDDKRCCRRRQYPEALSWPHKIPQESRQSVQIRAQHLARYFLNQVPERGMICAVGHSYFFQEWSGLPRLNHGECLFFKVLRSDLETYQASAESPKPLVEICTEHWKA